MFDRLIIVVRFFLPAHGVSPDFKAVATSKHEGKHPAEMPDFMGTILLSIKKQEAGWEKLKINRLSLLIVRTRNNYERKIKT